MKQLNRINDKKTSNKGITKRNNIQTTIGYKELYDILHKRKLDAWEQKVLDQQMITDKIEHHLVINPNIVDYSEYKLLEVFREILIKFYRKKLGKNFNKKKDQQMNMLFAPEYGPLYNSSKIKETHLHCIIQADSEDMLKEFHKFMKNGLKTYFGKINYKKKKITTITYRINCYNYIRKEGRGIFDNTDFYYKKSDKNKLF